MTGFQIASCRSDFILTFRFRVIVVICFFIPLLFMSFLYIRIFAIIKRHQAQRAIQRQQSCQISTRSRLYASHGPSALATHHFPATPKRSSLLVPHSVNNSPTAATNTTTTVDQHQHKSTDGKESSNQASECQLGNEPLLVSDNGALTSSSTPEERSANMVPKLSLRRQHLQRQQRFNSLMVTAKPEQKLTKTMLYRSEMGGPELDTEGAESKHQRDCFMILLCSNCCKYRLGRVSRHSSSTSSHSSGSSFYYKDNITNNSSIGNASMYQLNEKSSRPAEVHNSGSTYFAASQPRYVGSHPNHSYYTQANNSTRSRLGHSSGATTYDQQSNTGHAKALVTTLLILGTYLLCWMPAVVFYALTCIDHCPFPITTINYRWRIIISFLTNGLVILKAFVDPFIYTYRMKEMKSALNRYVRLPFANNHAGRQHTTGGQSVLVLANVPTGPVAVADNTRSASRPHKSKFVSAATAAATVAKA